MNTKPPEAGTYKAKGFEIEPSAKIYGLWESENAYTDSLGTSQAERNFTTGRASTGVKFTYPLPGHRTSSSRPISGFTATTTSPATTRQWQRWPARSLLPRRHSSTAGQSV
jgi:hypothetical protein